MEKHDINLSIYSHILIHKSARIIHHIKGNLLKNGVRKSVLKTKDLNIRHETIKTHPRQKPRRKALLSLR